MSFDEPRSGTPNVLWFDVLGLKDLPLVGGKNANLGEMIRNTRVPVPDGFAVTTAAYRRYIKYNDLDGELQYLMDQITDPKDLRQVAHSGNLARQSILKGVFPPGVDTDIVQMYWALSHKFKVENVRVAVRSSATAEDLPTASFAGQQDTYLHIGGAQEVLDATRKCFASLFNNRAIVYRMVNNFEHMEVALSAAIQYMVYSEAAGVMFTVDMRTMTPDKITIEGSWGVGESVVGGEVNPDTFIIDKSTAAIVRRVMGMKEITLVPTVEGITELMTAPEDRVRPCLSDLQILELADYAMELENYYEKPQDIEWARDSRDHKQYIVQSRPITWLKRADRIPSPAMPIRPAVPHKPTAPRGTVVVVGVAATPGIPAHTGKAHVVKDISELIGFRPGDIIVTKKTDPDWVVIMEQAGGFVTDTGGMTSHAAIVAREMGKPAVCGTANGTIKIKEGEIITVDGAKGIVYK